MDLRFQVLGPVSAWRDGDLLDLGPAGQRVLLGLLLLACGRPMSRDEIAAGLWLDRRPPRSAANVIQTYVKRLRRLLEPQRAPRTASSTLRQIDDGYALHVPESAIDLVRFRAHVTAALTAQRHGEAGPAAAALESALALWQGQPFAGIPALAGHPKVLALAAERHAALARYGEVLLAAGRAADALPAWEEAASAQPLNEAWQAGLIRAYQAAGRRGQAFAAYHDVRRRLADELGVDPGSELTAAHAELLRADRANVTAASAAVAVTEPNPAQLPAGSQVFVGRTGEMAFLKGKPLVLVCGAPGIGKTALAVAWARRIADGFPDGQLFVNLRGFDPGGVVMEPGEAVRCFLDALGVPPERMPSTVDDRAALYRSMLAGRRMLIVLDNARDAAQVRPLLPGAAGCTVLVTSRNDLAGLVAADGAHPLPLAVLGFGDARNLLVQRIGEARVAREPDAVAEILDRCAGLPLALAVIAARAAMNPALPLRSLAAQLGNDRLEALAIGDPGTDLAAVISWSYRALAPDAARLLRLLGLHPGPDISEAAAASLAALTIPAVRRLLAELVRANLVSQTHTGRYALHDLIRVFAFQQCEQGRSRDAALARMHDHYLHSAYAADRMWHPARGTLTLDSPAFGVVPEYPCGVKEALEWFTAEHQVLVGLIHTAPDRHAWRLAWSASTFLDSRGHWEELAATQHVAIAAARREGDAPAQAGAHRSLARAQTRLRRLDEAETQLHQALSLYESEADREGLSNTHINLSLLRERQGHYEQALAHARRARDLMRRLGDRYGQARALNAIGWYHALLGDHARALTLCRRAMSSLKRIDDRIGQACTWDSLGYAYHHLGDHDRACAAFHQAIELYRDVGDRHLEGLVHLHLGDAHDTAGEPEAARAAWRDALDRLEHLDPLEAGRVRARLSD